MSATPPDQRPTTHLTPAAVFKAWTGEAAVERLGVSPAEFQDRVRRLAFASAVILAVSLAIRLVTWLAADRPSFLEGSMWWHAASLAPFALLWLVARGPQRSLRAMRLWDATALKLAVFALSLFALVIEPPFLADLIVTLALFFLVTVRVAFIPTTGRRAALEVWVVFAIQAVVILFIHDPASAELQSEIAAMVTELGSFGDVEWDLTNRLVSKAIWWLLIGIAAVTVARVVHGLRLQVVDAHELGQYTLVERLGQGGMGEVWRARHARLRRPTAVKLLSLPAGEDAASRVARFEREAQATAELSSPHTVQLYDFGRTDDGRFYYVMELLDGLDLRAFVERFGPAPPERVVHWLRQACHSLAEAHARGLVHRDVKPANLFVARVGLDVDVLKILDFGLVRGSGAVDADSPRLTREGVVSGTPAYVSPEQVLGAPDIDGRADLYGLGCVAYLALTGRDVFEARTATALCVAHASEAPVAPSDRCEVALPEALDALVLDLLAKDPAARPATAEALRERLDAIPLARPWTAERAARWWAAHLPAAGDAT